MRLAICLHRACTSIERMPDHDGPPEFDHVLERWIERHLHGVDPEHTPGADHPGGRVVQVDTAGISEEDEAFETLMNVKVSEIAAEMEAMSNQVFEYRDELRESASACFQAHHTPDATDGRMCIDYRTKAKLVGRGDQTPPEYRKFLCDFCPYSSTVMVEVRRRRGAYR